MALVDVAPVLASLEARMTEELRNELKTEERDWRKPLLKLRIKVAVFQTRRNFGLTLNEALTASPSGMHVARG